MTRSAPQSARHGPPAATMFAANLLLAAGWVAITGQYSLESLALGFVIGYVALLPLQRALGPSPYFRKAGALVRFGAFYLAELVKANLRVAYEVVTPRIDLHPGILAIPLEASSDVEITLLANLITMTPGSLSVDVSDDRTTLYVHSLFTQDREAFRSTIKDDFERRVLELLR